MPPGRSRGKGVVALALTALFIPLTGPAAETACDGCVALLACAGRGAVFQGQALDMPAGPVTGTLAQLVAGRPQRAVACGGLWQGRGAGGFAAISVDCGGLGFSARLSDGGAAAYPGQGLRHGTGVTSDGEVADIFAAADIADLPAAGPAAPYFCAGLPHH